MDLTWFTTDIKHLVHSVKSNQPNRSCHEKQSPQLKEVDAVQNKRSNFSIHANSAAETDSFHDVSKADAFTWVSIQPAPSRAFRRISVFERGQNSASSQKKVHLCAVFLKGTASKQPFEG